MATTIAVSKETKRLLDVVTLKSESYDEALRRILRKMGEQAMHEKWDRIIEEEEFTPFEFEKYEEK